MKTSENTQSKADRGLTRPDVVKRIIDQFPAYKSEYLLWRFAPEAMSTKLENNTFEELKVKANLPDVCTEQTCKIWLLDETVQELVRVLLERKNTQQLLELQQKYVEKAQNDPNSLKALLQINEVLFKNSGDKLLSILDGVSDDILGGG